jgi:hypothetical protein
VTLSRLSLAGLLLMCKINESGRYDLMTASALSLNYITHLADVENACFKVTFSTNWDWGSLGAGS